MKQRRILSLLLALALCVTLLPQLTSVRADEPEPEPAEIVEPKEPTPVSLQLVTEPLINTSITGSDKRIYPLYDCICLQETTGTGQKSYLLNRYGEKLYSKPLEGYSRITDDVYLLSLEGDAGSTLYRDGTPLTPYQYKSFKQRADGYVFTRTTGRRDFFDSEFHRRMPCTLPSGYTPYFVASNGYTIASYAEPQNQYAWQIFDTAGKPLFDWQFQGMSFMPGSSYYLAGYRVPNYVAIDIYGNQYNNAQTGQVFCVGDRIISGTFLRDQQADVSVPWRHYCVFDKAQNKVDEFDGLVYEHFNDNKILLVMGTNGKYGLYTENGWAVEPQYTSYETNENELQLYGSAPNGILIRLFSDGDISDIYDCSGRLLRHGEGVKSVSFWNDSFLFNIRGGPLEVYDGEGVYCFTLPEKTGFFSCSGVWFTYQQFESSGYLFRQVNRKGEYVSDRTGKEPQGSGVYGLAVFDGYVVNTAGQEQLGFPISNMGYLFSGDWTGRDGEMLAVYEKGAGQRYQGVCRLVYPGSGEFADVYSDDWFAGAVQWATTQEPAITSGTTLARFDPTKTCTRAEVVQFLWNAVGKPAPAEGTANPFADISEGDWYYKAVLWAVANGVTAGTDETHFSPDKKCTRAEVVTFLRSTAKEPDAQKGDLQQNPFTDVKETDWYYTSVLWAVANGITSGTTPTTFSPGKTCTRAEVVQFLYQLDQMSESMK